MKESHLRSIGRRQFRKGERDLSVNRAKEARQCRVIASQFSELG